MRLFLAAVLRVAAVVGTIVLGASAVRWLLRRWMTPPPPPPPPPLELVSGRAVAVAAFDLVGFDVAELRSLYRAAFGRPAAPWMTELKLRTDLRALADLPEILAAWSSRRGRSRRGEHDDHDHETGRPTPDLC